MSGYKDCMLVCAHCAAGALDVLQVELVRPIGADSLVVCTDCAEKMRAAGLTEFEPHAACALCGAETRALTFHREPGFTFTRCLEGCNHVVAETIPAREAA